MKNCKKIKNCMNRGDMQNKFLVSMKKNFEKKKFQEKFRLGPPWSNLTPFRTLVNF